MDNHKISHNEPPIKTIDESPAVTRIGVAIMAASQKRYLIEVFLSGSTYSSWPYFDRLLCWSEPYAMVALYSLRSGEGSFLVHPSERAAALKKSRPATARLLYTRPDSPSPRGTISDRATAPRKDYAGANFCLIRLLRVFVPS